MQDQTKTVYGYGADGKYTETLILDHTDRAQNSGAWQYPADTTETAPPKDKDGFDRVYKAGAWEYVEQAKEDEPEQPATPEPPQQEYEYADPAVIALGIAIAAQEERLTALEGGTKA